MPDTNTLPDQIIETSRAFTQTLEMENKVFAGQLDSAVEMTINAVRELIALCKEAAAVGNANIANGRKNLAATAQKALSGVQNAASQANKAAPPLTPVEAVLDSAILHAVADSYNNAVAAQQQAYILQQAAATEVISTIVSLVTATLGVAIKVEESEGN